MPRKTRMTSTAISPVPKKLEHRNNTALARIEKSVPKAELERLLDQSDDPRAHHLVSLMFDISLKNVKLPELARRAGLQYSEVLRMITLGRLGDGALAMSEHAPQVMEDVAIDAKSRIVECPTCGGSGEVSSVVKGEKEDEEEEPSVETSVCGTCDGSGKLRKIGDIDARKLMFETLGLTNKGKGAMVNVNVNGAGLATVEDDLDTAQKVIDA